MNDLLPRRPWSARSTALTLAAALLVPGAVEARGQDLPPEEVARPSLSSPATDASIARALEYLKSSQKPDGAWESGDFGRMTSITSLAVMAFLASGHVPGEPGPYRDTLDRGIRYVLDHQHPNGLILSNPSQGQLYCHGISTLMLAEVVGMTNDPDLAGRCRTVLARAVKLILLAQNLAKNSNHAGGWRYKPTSRDSDLSVTGWQVMALRAAKSAGCSVPSDNIDRALDYVKRCANAHANEGGFGYQPGSGPNNPMTGTGTLTLEICGEHQGREAVAGAEYLVKHPPRWGTAFFFYEVYYCPQALFQVGDRYFLAYYPQLVSILLEHQDRNGSWLSGDGKDRAGGRVYCTAMGVLALAIEYRYLPIYQR